MAKRGWLFALVVVGALALPSVVYAAAGAFSAGGTTTALRVTQSGSGKAIRAVSNRGQAVWASRTNTDGKTPAIYGTIASNDNGARAIYGLAPKAGGRTFGVYGQTNGGGANASGVFGFASKATGLTNGVWGRSDSEDGAGLFGTGAFGSWGQGVVGTYGLGVLAGLAGESTGIADGSYGLWSVTDSLFDGHMLVSNGNIAGQCTIPEGLETATCDFDDAFADVVSPIMAIATPTQDVGDFWATATSTSVTVNSDTAADADGFTFNYLVIGVDTSLASASVSSAAASPAQQVPSSFGHR